MTESREYIFSQLPPDTDPVLRDYITHRPHLFPIEDIHLIQQWFLHHRTPSHKTDQQLLALTSFLEAKRKLVKEYTHRQHQLRRNDTTTNSTTLPCTKRSHIAVGAGVVRRC